MNNPVQFAFLSRRGGNVRRLHTVEVQKQNTVAAHSHGVAVMCDILCNHSPSRELLQYAMYHDMAEQETGDVPATAKWKHGMMKEACDVAEEQFNMTWGFPTKSTLMRDDQLVFLWADMLDFMFYCLEERMLGNMNVTSYFENGLRYLRKLDEHAIGKEILDNIVFAWNSPSECFTNWQVEQREVSVVHRQR